MPAGRTVMDVAGSAPLLSFVPRPAMHLPAVMAWGLAATRLP